MIRSVIRTLDAMSRAVGQATTWLVLVVVVISAGNATIRKLLDSSSNAWLEVQWYLFGSIFMLAAAWTLQRDEHVRIDVLTASRSRRTRDWIDLAGHVLFLLPFCLVMLWLSVPWAWAAFRSGEVSANAGGLILWPAKALVPLGFALLTLQAFAEILRVADRLWTAAGEPGS